MVLPKIVKVNEVGPREGIQIEDAKVSTLNKAKLINSLSETGLKSVETVSFVSPKWVPQMADAEEVMTKVKRVEGVSYKGVYLNVKGLQRAILNEMDINGFLGVPLSSTFSKKNTNRTSDETINGYPVWLEAYKSEQIPVNQIMIMTAFGCNFEGDIPLQKVIHYLTKSIDIASSYGEKIEKITLTDTMGWANPEQIKRTIYEIRNKWPDKDIHLHLHDTRGLGLANVYSALQEGVREFDSAIGGLGGCPFAATKGAAGNIATEDLVFMCEELGIETGIDLEAILECVELAENIFERKLPGHLLSGGLLRKSTNA